MMLELRKELIKLLKGYHPNTTVGGKSKSRVHFQRAKDDTPFPYITFNLPNSFTNGEQEVFVLDVDIWDDKDDTTTLENLSSTIWKGFNRLSHLDEDMQFSIYRDNRLPPLDDERNNYKRRKLIFELRYFDRRLFD